MDKGHGFSRFLRVRRRALRFYIATIREFPKIRGP